MFSKIKEAITDIKRGRFVIVVDNENRENEGDLVLAAQKATTDKINYMIKYGRGLVCMPILKQRLQHLNIPLMVNHNSPDRCMFTISVDYKNGSTGISPIDRAETIKALINPKSKPEDFIRPGHLFPLEYKEGGVLAREGHTEASVDLVKLAGMYPAAVICEIINDDGTMAKLPDLIKFSKKHNGMKIITIQDLIEYRKSKRQRSLKEDRQDIRQN